MNPVSFCGSERQFECVKHSRKARKSFQVVTIMGLIAKVFLKTKINAKLAPVAACCYDTLLFAGSEWVGKFSTVSLNVGKIKNSKREGNVDAR